MFEMSGNDGLEVSAPDIPKVRSKGPTKPKGPTKGKASSTPRRVSSKRKATPVASDTGTQSTDNTSGSSPIGLSKSRLLELYRIEVIPKLMSEFGYANIMEVPRVEKTIINIGLGEALTNPKAIESAIRDLTTIAGQKPIVNKAKKSIANFKLREGNPIGVSVTLRGTMMYHFLDRLMNAALPRIRDFRGIPSKSFDGRGNYALGIKEQIIFPEIDYGQIERIRGFQVIIVTSANTDDEASSLLRLLGMPIIGRN